jgi:hypothetical protein
MDVLHQLVDKPVDLLLATVAQIAGLMQVIQQLLEFRQRVWQHALPVGLSLCLPVMALALLCRNLINGLGIAGLYCIPG